jgi:hypothetical protein
MRFVDQASVPASLFTPLIGLSLAAGEDDLVHGPRKASVKKQNLPALAAAVLTVVIPTAASSAETAVAQSAAQPPVAEHASYVWPNNGLLSKGFFAFLGSYVPSVIVAVVNDNSYDKRLYIPIAGPWIDLASRPGCGGVGQSTCGAETGYKALLIVAGAVQTLGALAIVGGLTVPERRLTPAPAKADNKPTVHLQPAQVGRSGYGLAAFGTF